MATPPRRLLDALTVDRPDQLKALGHPLRLKVLEALGETDAPLTNRELAERIGVDPGHLHFHVRMLHRAGLIELVEGGRGREKPYRSVATHSRSRPSSVPTGARGRAERGDARRGQPRLGGATAARPRSAPGS